MIELPVLTFKRPSVINPCASKLQDAANVWMSEHGYLKTPKDAQHFERSKFAWMAARAHPHAPESEVLLVTLYMSWLFLVDDLCDEADLGRSPERLRALHERLVDVMRHPERSSAQDDTVIAGLADLWKRIVAKSSPSWPARFIRTFEDYALGCQWEARNRAGHVVPSLHDYLRMRRKSSALDIFFDLIELADHVTLPPEVFEHEQIKALKTMANDGVAWFNDIVSLEKEIRSGDVHNLVLVLQHHNGSTLEEAVQAAGEMFKTRMVEYDALEARRHRFAPQVDAELQRYLDGLRHWVRGNIDWSFETGRYGQASRPGRDRSAGAS